MRRMMSVTVALRVAQIICGLTSLILCLVFMYYGVPALVASAAWAIGGSIYLAAGALVFDKRRSDVWPLTLVLDITALALLLSALACLASIVAYGWSYPSRIAIAFTCVDVSLYAATAVRAVRLRRERSRKTRPADPLKPYLMKKEIDVWCYPVQDEHGQLFVHHDAAPPKAKAQSSSSSLAPSVKSYVQVLDHPQDSNRPLSDIETTAGWSVPSRNETLRRSQFAPSTALPSYRSPSATIDTRT